MRFAGLFSLVVVLSFAAGYALVNPAAPQIKTATLRPQLDAKSTAVLAAEPDTLPARRVDLFESLTPKDDQLAQAHAIRATIETLGASELRALFEPPGSDDLPKRLHDLPNDLYPSVFQDLVRRWLDVDEAAVLAWLPQAPRYFPKGSARLHLILGAVAERDAEAALDVARRHPESGYRDSLVHSLFEQLAKENPARARALFARVEDDPKVREAAENGYQRGLFATDPAAEINALKTAPEGEGKTNVFVIIAKMGEQTPAAILAACRVIDEPSDRSGALSQLATWNPVGAAHVAEEVLAAFPNDPVESRKSYVSSAAYAWARTNESQATAWALSLPEELRASALGRIAASLADIDPSAGSQYFGKLVRADSQDVPAPPSAEDRAALFDEWMFADAASARAWADGLPPGEVRNAMQAKVLIEDARRGHAEDVLRRAAALPIAQAKTVALLAAQSLAGQNGQRAADAMLEFARSTHEHEPLEVAVERWFSYDSQSAAAWVEQLPSGPARDAAAAACARVAVGVDAEAATAWVEQISDASRRMQAAEIVATEWKKRDALAAEAWLERLSAK
jgi:hypothetical protein